LVDCVFVFCEEVIYSQGFFKIFSRLLKAFQTIDFE